MFQNYLKLLFISLAIKRLCCGVQFHAFRRTEVLFNGRTMRHTTISKLFFFNSTFTCNTHHLHPSTHPPPPCFSGHYPCDGQTDREGSGFLCVVLWLLFCLHTSVCFRITGHSIGSRISESCNNNPDYGKQTCCLFSNPFPPPPNISHYEYTWAILHLHRGDSQQTLSRDTLRASSLVHTLI